MHTEDASKTPQILQDIKPPSSTDHPPILFSKRFIAVTLIFLGNINSSFIRYNMNIAIIEITSNKSITEGNTTVIIPPEEAWDTTTVSLILSMISYGALFSFLAAFLIPRYGGSVIYSVCTMLSGIITLMIPFGLRRGLYALLICRFCTGAIHSLASSSVAEIYAKWIPKVERSRLISFTLFGMYLGVAGVYPVCGFIADQFGWPMVFYVTGIFSIITAILFHSFLANHPSQDKHISERELTYIISTTEGTLDRKIIHPYKEIFTSSPVWALLACSFVTSWSSTALMDCFPLFIKDVTHINTQNVGLLSSIPNLANIFTISWIGLLMDYITNHCNITPTRMHKVIVSVSFMCEMSLYVANTFVSNLTILILLFGLIRLCCPVIFLTIQVITVNVAPNNVSAISTLTTFLSASSTIVAQTVVGFMTEHHSHQEWSRFYELTASLVLATATIFLIFGSSEAQSWSLTFHQSKTSYLSKQTQETIVN